MSNLASTMVGTVTNIPITDNVLTNDILNDRGGGRVVEVSFETLDAHQYISAHQLELLGAFEDADGRTVHIPVPASGDIAFTTPLGSTFSMDSTGNYQYDAAPVGEDEFERFTYTIQETNSTQTSQAILTINVLNDPNDLHVISGDADNNTISSENLEGIIVMSGKEGIDNFIIDTAQDAHNNLVIIKDLGYNIENSLTFINASDTDHDNILELSDIIQSVTQDGENADVVMKLNNGTTPDHSDGTTIVLENIGTLPSNDVASLQAHLEQITAQLNVIN